MAKEINVNDLTAILVKHRFNQHAARFKASRLVQTLRGYAEDSGLKGKQCETEEGFGLPSSSRLLRDVLVCELSNGHTNDLDRADRALGIMEEEVAQACKDNGSVHLTGLGDVVYLEDVPHALTSAKSSILAKHQEDTVFGSTEEKDEHDQTLRKLTEMFCRPGKTRPRFSILFDPRP